MSESKKIVITGGSKGIGRALSRKFIEEGHEVFVISRNQELLLSIKDQLATDKFRYAPLDLAREEDFENIHDYIYDWDRIDVIYNNAGLLIKKPFLELQRKDYLDSWIVNFFAPVMLIKSLFSKLHSDSHIVNISTMGAVQGSVKFPELTAYSTSKSALINLGEMLAAEFGAEGPKINSVALGAVQTEMLEKAFPGYEAVINPEQISDFFYNFGLNGHKFMNGKIIPCSLSTP
ncbi:MAG: SDR family oxidoreductase [Weeksellaceae bacterium]|nr:SDR family oxidoreductase [Weeksellaceae bacterium]